MHTSGWISKQCYNIFKFSLPFNTARLLNNSIFDSDCIKFLSFIVHSKRAWASLTKQLFCVFVSYRLASLPPLSECTLNFSNSAGNCTVVLYRVEGAVFFPQVQQNMPRSNNRHILLPKICIAMPPINTILSQAIVVKSSV